MHKFVESFERGKYYERLLDKYFSCFGEIEKVSRADQRKGIDRVFRTWDGIHTVEYKADEQAGKTGNAFIETISVDSNSAEGWAMKSQADYLIYYIPDNGQAYLLTMKSIRERLPHWIATYKKAKGVNMGYSSHGRLVPLREIARMALTAFSIEDPQKNKASERTPYLT